MIIDTSKAVEIGDRIVRGTSTTGARFTLPPEYIGKRYKRYVIPDTGVIVLVPYHEEEEGNEKR